MMTSAHETYYTRSLIEASHDPLFTINVEGQITDLNAASCKALAISREDLIGSNFLDYFTDKNKAKEGYEQVFEKGFIVNYPLTITDHKFTDVLFNGSVYRDEDNNIIGAVVVCRDITDQNRIEKELTEAKIFAELATQIAEDAKINADSLLIVAKDAVRSKQQFLSNMSHEIRTPMNAIIGFTKVVLKTKLSDKQIEYLNAIKLSGDALIVLIDDILDLAKVDAGKMTFEKVPFKLSTSIAAMLHLFETKIQEKNLKLIKYFDPAINNFLVGDPVRLHQIVLNLISNAVKFTSKGNISISIKLIHEDENTQTISFTISDTGIGIPGPKLETIFENFQQASSGTSRIYGGTGLGLAIVKQLVESQNGTIEVTSEVMVGSSFEFILGFDKVDKDFEMEAETALIAREEQEIKVLVVEDIALNQLLMKTLLDDFGFEREIAANGKLAIEKLEHTKFDIILMDLQMPEMNGFEATEYIRNVMKLDVPIVALTADVTTVDVEKCKAVGMNDYISKPVDENELYMKIVSIVKKSRLSPKKNDFTLHEIIEEKKKYTNLSYLLERTKSNPVLMSEMISLYLEQTPPLILTMKDSLQKKDWISLHSAVHKMIPSFSIVGIAQNYESLARKVQDYAMAQELTDDINDLVKELETVCTNACHELMDELENLKKAI
ncbi:MAG: ATP-binding protein [Bacteroidota bacterium]